MTNFTSKFNYSNFSNLPKQYEIQIKKFFLIFGAYKIQRKCLKGVFSYFLWTYNLINVKFEIKIK